MHKTINSLFCLETCNWLINFNLTLYNKDSVNTCSFLNVKDVFVFVLFFVFFVVVFLFQNKPHSISITNLGMQFVVTY